MDGIQTIGTRTLPQQAASGERAYFVAVGGSSMIQGQVDIVFTLPLLFLMTVIFMMSLG
jgi:hypothetical protein